MMKDNDERLKDTIAGIKTKKTIRKIARCSDNGVLEEVEESKSYKPGKGIIHVQRITNKLLDCGHPESVGLGHIATCGHSVCALCVERYILECAESGCFMKLCTVSGCECCARDVGGIFYCPDHILSAKFGFWGSYFLMNREKREDIIRGLVKEYYGRRIQIRGKK